MPRFIIERNVGTLTREELDAAGRKSVEVLTTMPGVIWIRSYVSDSEGKIYCEYDAPTRTRSASTHGVRGFRWTGSPRSRWRSARRCSGSDRHVVRARRASEWGAAAGVA